MTQSVPHHQSRRDDAVGGAAVYRRSLQHADRRWHRALRVGLALAVLVHVAAVLLSRGDPARPRSPFAAAGPQAGDVRAAAGGGSGLTMVEVRPRQEQVEEVPEPVLEPVLEPVPEDVVVEEPLVEPDLVPELGPAVVPSLPGTAAAGSGGEEGSSVGPGTATGEGRGGGGDDEEGASDLIAPTPRGMILPPSDRPASARGQEITVWVFVSARGRVLPDSTRLEPPTRDSRYNERLKRSAAEWVFEPARREGRPVGAWYPYQIIL